MNANQQEKLILQLEEKQKLMSSEIERLESMMIDKQGSKDDDDEVSESKDFMTMQEALEEFQSLNQSLFSKQCNAYGKLTQAFQKMRHHGGKEKSNRKNVELEKMLCISRDENVALKTKMNEMEKCMEEKEAELKDLESFNQTIMAMERKNNHENQDVRKELIKSMQGMHGCVNIGIKRLGELDLAPFTAVVKKRKCSGSGPPEAAGLESDLSVEAELLCSLWEKHLADPGWHPFKTVAVGDKYQEILDDEDPKLKSLKSELGEDAYKAVITSLVELNEHNPSGRFPISEIWNFKEGRKASLKEGYSVVLEKLKIVGNNSVVSSPIIATTNPSSSASGSNIAAANTPSYLDGCEIPDVVVSSPIIATTDLSSSAPSYLDGCEIPDVVVSSPIIATTDPSSSAPSYLDGCEIPDAAFHDFMAHKSEGNFQSGQFWAMYGYSDELPRNYVQITEVKLYPEFEVHVQPLGSSYPSWRRIRWDDEDMPICCGSFMVGDKTEVYKDIKAFSHMLHANGVLGSSCEIYPRNGEVWAVYKNFNPKWTSSDLKTCTYDIVEVLVVTRKIRVHVLEQVSGYKTVFKPKIVSEFDHITHAKSLTISHQIPAFRLTDQKKGSLRGYWELDPNSIPVHYFSSN